MKTNEELAQEAGFMQRLNAPNEWWMLTKDIDRFATLVEQRLIARLTEGVGEPAWVICIDGRFQYFSSEYFLPGTSVKELEEYYGKVPCQKIYSEDQLAAAVLPYKQDAERYRWLRNPETDCSLVLDKRTGWVPPDETVPGVGGYHTYEYRAGDELDAVIDAAIRGATT